jgi:16S rRNA (uracil1498-N3)-methyltransferase
VNLLLVEASEVDEHGTVTIRDGRARHLLDVLKVAPGQGVRVGVIDGGIGSGRVVSAALGAVTLSCAFDAAPERPRVDLLLALPRPKVLRRLWAQFAALGVGRIILTNAYRVERDYFDTHLLEPAVYRPLLLEGLQQARDTLLPEVSVHRRFRVLVEDELPGLSDHTQRLVADPASEGTLRDAVAGAATTRVLLAVGPEGGWNPFELELLRSHGFRSVGLGSRTLRSDTAVIALLALAHDALRTSNRNQ